MLINISVFPISEENISFKASEKDAVIPLSLAQLTKNLFITTDFSCCILFV